LETEVIYKIVNDATQISNIYGYREKGSRAYHYENQILKEGFGKKFQKEMAKINSLPWLLGDKRRFAMANNTG
jgi:hypothetical protein